MRYPLAGKLVLAGFVLWGAQASAHHSTTYYFDTTKAITLEGEIMRVEWVNPHILVYLQSKNSNGGNETWILEGLGPGVATGSGLPKQMLQIGSRVSVRAHPPRRGLFLDGPRGVQTGDSLDSSKSSHIVEAGEIRLPNGEVRTLGRGPKFM